MICWKFRAGRLLFMELRYDELSCLHIFLSPFLYRHKCVYARSR